MSKILKTAFIAALIAGALCSQAAAQVNRVGLGIMLGEPTGFSAKVWRDGITAVDGGIAWSMVDEQHLTVHGDMLWHNREVLNNAFDVDEDDGSMPFYYGIGGRIKADNETRIGVRFVTGASFEFTEAPFDLFFEIVPVMDIVPKTELEICVGIGARFWF